MLRIYLSVVWARLLVLFSLLKPGPRLECGAEGLDLLQTRRR